MDLEKLETILRADAADKSHRFNNGDPITGATRLRTYFQGICNKVMPHRKTATPRRSVFWWSDDIAALRHDAITSLREYQRAGRRGILRIGKYKDFKRARKTLRIAIKKAQEAAWNNLINMVEADPWGRAYRIVTKKLSLQLAGAEAAGREPDIIDGLFPKLLAIEWETIPIWTNADEDNIPLQFTEAELEAATRKLPTGKAPGPDGIVNEILSTVARCNPDVLIELYNLYLRAVTFPMDWKITTVCLLYKGPGKPVTEPSTFRPISLLDGFGKLYERMILNRVAADINARLAQNQYGFRPGRGTEDAIGTVLEIAGGASRGPVQDRHLCIMVTFDVKNAFNLAPWRLIDIAVTGFGLPAYFRKLVRSYLSERFLLVPSGNTSQLRAMT